MEDFSKGNVLQDFMERYGELKLDVVSLAEVKEFIKSANPSGETNVTTSA